MGRATGLFVAGVIGWVGVLRAGMDWIGLGRGAGEVGCGVGCCGMGWDGMGKSMSGLVLYV